MPQLTNLEHARAVNEYVSLEHGNSADYLLMHGITDIDDIFEILEASRMIALHNREQREAAEHWQGVHLREGDHETT